jgi:hypothetical protein
MKSPASVKRPMRRTSFLALLAVLLLASPAYADTTTQIIRDCQDDGVLQGHYTPAQLRTARSNIPTDVDEYSDCSDVLSRAIAAGTQSDSSSGGGGGGTTPTGGSPSSGGGTGGGAAPAASATPNPATMSDTSADSGKLAAPYTPADHVAVDQAAAAGRRPVDLDGHNVVPTARLAADIGRNSVPTPLVVVLALLIAGALAAASMPLLRRRGLTHRQS